MSKFSKAIATLHYMRGFTIMTDALDERAAKIEAALASEHRLSGVQWRSMNDAAEAVRRALAQVQKILANFERKKDQPFSADELAAVMLVGHELGIAEAFLATVEMEWPAALERVAAQIDTQLLNATDNSTPH